MASGDSELRKAAWLVAVASCVATVASVSVCLSVGRHAKEISVEKLSVVDRDGTVLIQLTADEFGPRVLLFDREEVLRVELASSRPLGPSMDAPKGHGSFIAVRDANSATGIELQVDDSKPLSLMAVGTEGRWSAMYSRRGPDGVGHGLVLDSRGPSIPWGVAVGSDDDGGKVVSEFGELSLFRDPGPSSEN